MKNVGGYTDFRKVKDDDMKVFNEAMENHVGVQFTPHEVATQVVNGTNYRFKCISKVVAPDTKEEECLVEIYKPIQGKAELNNIIPAN